MSDLEKNIDSEEPAEEEAAEEVADDGAGESQIDGASYYEAPEGKSGESQITGAKYYESSSGKSGESQITGATYMDASSSEVTKGDAPGSQPSNSEIDGAEYYESSPGKSGESQITGAEYMDAPSSEVTKGDAPGSQPSNSEIDGAEYVSAPSGQSGESQIDGAEYVSAPAGQSGESQIDGAEYMDTPSGKSGKSQISGSKVYSVKPKKSGKSQIEELKAKPPAALDRPESTNYYSSKPKKSGKSTIEELRSPDKYEVVKADPSAKLTTASTLKKATIINLDESGEDSFIECQFNPTEYTITKRNTWRKKSGQGQDIFATPEFKGGKPAQLKMELFFDTSHTDSGDVRDTTNKIWKLMEIVPSTVDTNTNKGRTYKCQFWWGGEKYFTAAVTNIRQKFIMFRPDGVPIRAKLNITFQQLGNDNVFPPQNPTSLSQARRTYVVGTGDRIDLIAFREYGDATLWHDLAAANGLENPMDLKVGQVIKIVDL